MDRRELLRMIAALTGGVVIGGEVFLTGCKNPDNAPTLQFSDNDLAFLNEVGDTILPATQTPGAKDANVSAVMQTIVRDCYSKDEQDVFLKGITSLQEACQQMHGHGFMKAAPEERSELLLALEKESKEYQAKKGAFDYEQNQKAKEALDNGIPGFRKEEMPAHYYTMMKQLTLLGYFTSEPGCKQAQRFNPIPGRYEGCIPYAAGDKAYTG